MSNELIKIIIGAVLVLIIAVVIFIKYKTSPKQEDKDAAKQFLIGLSDAIYDKALYIIKNFNYNDYENIAEIETMVVGEIINGCKEFVELELQKSTDILSVLSLKCLQNSNMIEDFILELIDKKLDPANEILTILGPKMEEELEKSEQQDKELAERFADTDYNESDIEELPEAEIEEIPEEDLQKLNPQIDEEENYNSDDESMELLIENDEIYYDSMGRARSRKTGRYVKVNK